MAEKVLDVGGMVGAGFLAFSVGIIWSICQQEKERR